MTEATPQKEDSDKSADLWLRDAGIPPAEVCQLWLLDLLDLETLVAANCFGTNANRRWQWSDFDVSSQGNLKYRALSAKATPRLGPKGRVATSLVLQIAKARGGGRHHPPPNPASAMPGVASQTALAGLYEELVEWAEQQEWIEQIPALVASHARYCQSQFQELKPTRIPRKSTFRQLRPVVITAVLIAIGGYALIELAKNQPTSTKLGPNPRTGSEATSPAEDGDEAEPEGVEGSDRKMEKPDQERNAADLDFGLSENQIALVEGPVSPGANEETEDLAESAKAAISLRASDVLDWQIDLSENSAPQSDKVEPSSGALEKQTGESPSAAVNLSESEHNSHDESKSDGMIDWFAELVGRVPEHSAISPTDTKREFAVAQTPAISWRDTSQIDREWDSNLIAKTKKPVWRMIVRAESAFRIEPFGLQVAEKDRVFHWMVSEKNELPVLIVEVRSKIAPAPSISVRTWICFSRHTGLVAANGQAVENFFSQLSRFQLDIGRRLNQIELQFSSATGAARTLLRNERTTISKWQKEVDRLLESKAELLQTATELTERTELHGELVDLQQPEVPQIISFGNIADTRESEPR